MTASLEVGGDEVAYVTGVVDDEHAQSALLNRLVHYTLIIGKRR